MKNSFGNSLITTIFGESHGPSIGVTLDGLAPGIEIDEEFINHQLELRRPYGKMSTARVEKDNYQIVSGVYKGRTTGTPLCFLVPNESQHSKDYESAPRIARPGHADYTAVCKYHGYEDFRGGGHFSGRITAALVGAGAIALKALNNKGIYIGTHIKALGDLTDRDFADYASDINLLSTKKFAVLNDEVSDKMQQKIEEVALSKDSIGGVLETVIIGVESGIGEPWFDSVESMLSHAMFSIPAVKGIQFGAGFDKVCSLGSEYNDPYRVVDGQVVTTTNNNGGINGGITNGMPIMFRLAIKPTPSIYKEQKSIDLKTMENADLSIAGRHDPAIIHRARVVVDTMTALCLYDCIAARMGTDYFMP